MKPVTNLTDVKTFIMNDPDNAEGMTFVPPLSDGRQTLILVSDNNFNSAQITQFILLALDLESTSGD